MDPIYQVQESKSAAYLTTAVQAVLLWPIYFIFFIILAKLLDFTIESWMYVIAILVLITLILLHVLLFTKPKLYVFYQDRVDIQAKKVTTIYYREIQSVTLKSNLISKLTGAESIYLGKESLKYPPNAQQLYPWFNQVLNSYRQYSMQQSQY